MTIKAIDPHNINIRLQNQISELLRQLEEGDADIKTRYMALMAIARMQAVFVALRKEKFDEPTRGSSVRKYAGAFTKAHDPGRRKTGTGPDAPAEPDDDLDAIIDGTDSGDDD